jgi:hypothetical protein
LHSTGPGGSYGLYPQFKFDDTPESADVVFVEDQDRDTVTYTTLVHLFSSEGSIYVQQRYIDNTSYIDLEPWLFVVWDKRQKEIVGTWYASDHPSYGQSGDANEIPHPFADFWEPNDIMRRHHIPNHLELILVDLDKTRELEMKASFKRTVSEIVHEEYTVDESRELTYSPRDITYATGQYMVVKKIPEYIKVRTLKPRPLIQVITPNGGETLQQGMTYTIQWHDHVAEDVVIELLQSDLPMKEIATVPSNGIYQWRPDPALPPGDDYVIKIKSSLNNTIADTSDAGFTLHP